MTCLSRAPREFRSALRTPFYIISLFAPFFNIRRRFLRRENASALTRPRMPHAFLRFPDFAAPETCAAALFGVWAFRIGCTGRRKSACRSKPPNRRKTYDFRYFAGFSE